MAGISPVDLALIPVGGWGPSLGETHLDPAQAAEAVHRAKAATAVPVHYGTFWPVGFSRVRPHLFHSPAREFVRHAATVAPHTTVRVLRHGETTTVGSGA
jgi:L-ascorbate metabolism protein UlaG (beta-lactamase superfamily)